MDEKFTLVQGDTVANWARIEAGSNVTHNFILRAPHPGVFNSTSAVVTYSSKNGQKFTSLSTDLVRVQVWRSNEAARRSAPHYRYWGTFLGLVLASIAIPLVSYLSIRSRYTNGVPNSLLKKQK